MKIKKCLWLILLISSLSFLYAAELPEFKREVDKAINDKNDSALAKIIQDGDREAIDYGFYIALQIAGKEMAQQFLDGGADINHQDSLGVTPLIMAINQKLDKEIVTMLLDRGANPNIQDNSGQTALMHAIIWKSPIKIVKILLKKGSDATIQDNQGRIALMYAITTNADKKIITLLLDNTADINIQDKWGKAAFMYILDKKDEELIEKVIDKIDPNIQDKNGQATLLTVMQRKPINHKLVELLLEKGADPNNKNQYNTTPLIIAVKNNDNKLVKLLLDKGANPNVMQNGDWAVPLIDAIKSNNMEIIQMLLDHGADVNMKGLGQRNSLLTAVAARRSPTIIKLFLDHGADVNGKDVFYNSTALMYALGIADDRLRMDNLTGFDTKNVNEEIVQMLLDAGATIYDYDRIQDRFQANTGKTDLMIAILRGLDKKYIQMLLDKGIWGKDLNLKDKSNKTALMYAQEKGDKELVAMLKKAGAR